MHKIIQGPVVVRETGLEPARLPAGT